MRAWTHRSSCGSRGHTDRSFSPRTIARRAATAWPCRIARAYCGAPAEATAEEGHETFATLTDMLVELVEVQA